MAKGAPVVIVDRGGVPVVAVEGAAPLLTVAERGRAHNHRGEIWRAFCRAG